MRSLLLILTAAAFLSGCRTERTVIAGPTRTSLSGGGDGSEVDANSRFQARDPFGYESNESGGLNALSGKMFSGSTPEKDMKQFQQTRDFVTKRYSGNTAELSSADKRSFLQRLTSPLTGRKARESGSASEAERAWQGGTPLLGTPASRYDGQSARTRDFSEADRTAPTRNFVPAEKALEPGRSDPPMMNADPKEADRVTSLIMSRTRDDPATIDDIRAALGKP
jgi:hypothetical protein